LSVIHVVDFDYRGTWERKGFCDVGDMDGSKMEIDTWLPPD
jgi:hypothetical protein